MCDAQNLDFVVHFSLLCGHVDEISVVTMTYEGVFAIVLDGIYCLVVSYVQPVLLRATVSL